MLLSVDLFRWKIIIFVRLQPKQTTMKKNLLIILIALPFFAISQTFVSTTPENKNVILEEFTGITCVYCPDGHIMQTLTMSF